jgi:hypothetical protein
MQPGRCRIRNAPTPLSGKLPDVTIKVKCISCGGRHRYSLRIKRQLVLGASSDDAATNARHTIYVICPKTKETIAVDIEIEDRDGRPIVSIETFLDERDD